jgi:hypothetical protein
VAAVHEEARHTTNRRINSSWFYRSLAASSLVAAADLFK